MLHTREGIKYVHVYPGHWFALPPGCAAQCYILITARPDL